MERWTSALVSACEGAWGAIQKRHPDVPDAVIVVATRGRRPIYGHFARGTWKVRNGAEEPESRHEVLLAGEGLARGARSIFETLLHESCHGIAVTRGLQDTSANGRYHNRKFRALAEEVGLMVEPDKKFGTVTPDVTEETAKTYERQIEAIDRALKLWRIEVPKVTVDRNYVPVICGCDRKIRVSRKTLDEGDILCSLCDEPFSPA